jgi:putative transposase
LTEIKKIKGRKRHIIVDSLGHLLSVKVHSANRHDTKAGTIVVDDAIRRYHSLAMICGDAGYHGTTTLHVISNCGLNMLISKRIKDDIVSIKRWIVERTFAWLGWYRRVTTDYERLTGFAENMVKVAMLSLGIRAMRRK